MFEGVMNRFGEIAVWLGLLEERELDEALESQDDTGKRIGEHLEDLGHIRRRHTDVILKAQSSSRRRRLTRRQEAAGGDPRLAALDLPGSMHEARLSKPSESVLLLELFGALETEPEHLPSPIPREADEVLVVSLAGVTRINHGGAIAIWYASGGQDTVFCQVPPEAMALYEEVGVSKILAFAHTLEEGLARARDWTRARAADEAAAPAETAQAAAAGTTVGGWVAVRGRSTYHRPDCPSLLRTSAKRLLRLCADDLAGYTPCRICAQQA